MNLKPRYLKRTVCIIGDYSSMTVEQTKLVNDYFQKTIFPMLTPMLFDNYHTFPTLKNNRLLIWCCYTYSK